MVNAKKIMRIGTHGKYTTQSGKYRVHWGTTGNSYNRQHRSFNLRSTAVKFVNSIKRKFKTKYKIHYQYLAS